MTFGTKNRYQICPYFSNLCFLDVPLDLDDVAQDNQTSSCGSTLTAITIRAKSCISKQMC
eukprot:5231859-Amphidinium_carterae.1